MQPTLQALAFLGDDSCGLEPCQPQAKAKQEYGFVALETAAAEDDSQRRQRLPPLVPDRNEDVFTGD